MDLLFYRYRHLTVLLVVILAQLGLLAYQVRNDQDVRLIRVWSVTAVTPLARLLDFARNGSSSFIDDYFLSLNARQENKRLQEELNKTTLEVQRLRADLETADRAQALAIFQKESPMKTLAARVIMNTTANNASGINSTVFVDVGSSSGVEKGMAVITPEGIVGKITDVYPTASMVLLMNDPQFAAGVVSQKGHVQGTLKGQGSRAPIVDYVQNEQSVDDGEWFYTSGNDFIFPRGLRVGTAASVKNGNHRKEITIQPSGFHGAPREVLVVIAGVHTPIPDAPAPAAPISLLPPPADSAQAGTAQDPAGQAAQSGPLATDADRILNRLRTKGAPAAAIDAAAAASTPEVTPPPTPDPAAAPARTPANPAAPPRKP